MKHYVIYMFFASVSIVYAANISSTISHSLDLANRIGLPELLVVGNFVTPSSMQVIEGYNNTEVTVYPVYHQARGVWPAEEIEILECTDASCDIKKLSLEKIRKFADGTNCGYHALKNAYCFLMAYETGDVAWLQNMQDIPFFLQLLKPWLQFTLPYRSLGADVYASHPLGNWPSSDELNRLLALYENKDLEAKLKKYINFRDYFLLQNQAFDYMFTLMRHGMVPSEYITVVDKLAMFGYDQAADHLITEDTIQILKNIQKRFMIQKRAMHAFVVNTSAANTNGQSGVHWITMVMYKQDKKIKWAFASSLPGYTEIISHVQKTFDFSIVNVRDVKYRSLVTSNADAISRFEQQVENFYHANISLVDRIRGFFGYKISSFDERKNALESILQKLYNPTFVQAMQVPEYKEKISSIIQGLFYFLDENQSLYNTELYNMSLNERVVDLKTLSAILKKIYTQYNSADPLIFKDMTETLISLSIVSPIHEDQYEMSRPVDFSEDDLHL